MQRQFYFITADVLSSDRLNTFLAKLHALIEEENATSSIVVELHDHMLKKSATTEILGFSPRELEVWEAVRHGLQNKEIAYKIGITDATVKVHLKSIFRKTGVANRTQLALRPFPGTSEPTSE